MTRNDTTRPPRTFRPCSPLSEPRFQGLGHLFQGAIELEQSGLAREWAGQEDRTRRFRSAQPKLRASALNHLKLAAAQLPEVAEAQARYGVALVLSQEQSLGRQFLQNALRLATSSLSISSGRPGRSFRPVIPKRPSRSSRPSSASSPRGRSRASSRGRCTGSAERSTRPAAAPATWSGRPRSSKRPWPWARGVMPAWCSARHRSTCSSGEVTRRWRGSISSAAGARGTRGRQPGRADPRGTGEERRGPGASDARRDSDSRSRPSLSGWKPPC